MLGHKTNFKKFKKNKIIQSYLLQDNGKKLEIQNRRKSGKFTNNVKIKQHTPNNQWVKEEITTEIRKIPQDE